jgi:membrane-associated phospholipid phosphatase
MPMPAAAPALHAAPRRAPHLRRARSDAARRPTIEAGARPSAVPALLAAAVGVGAVTAAALVWSERAPVAPLDRLVRRTFSAKRRHRVPADVWWLGGRSTQHHRVNEALGGLTGQWPTALAGGAAALAVARRHGLLRALPVLATVPLANMAHAALKYGIRRPRPLTARLTGKHTPSVPSGHAARGAAAAAILGHVARREGVLRPAVAFPLGAAAAVAGGASRVYVERHWATDAVGGWGLGAAVGALCALWYDRATS